METVTILSILGGVAARVFSRVFYKEYLTPEQEIVAFIKATFGTFLCIVTAGGGIFEVRESK